MSAYTSTVINGKTIWIPVQQEAQTVPTAVKRKPKQQIPKRIGKRYGERKTWW